MDYKRLAESDERDMGVPPVRAEQPETPEARMEVEFHYAILATQPTSKNDWHRFPTYKEYITARTSGQMVGSNGHS